MNESAAIRAVERINRYRKGRENLEKVLSQFPAGNGAAFDDELRRAETELEQAFADLVAGQPENVSELLLKSRVLIDEVIGEADLTKYQIHGLQSVLNDLANLVSLIQNQKPKPKTS